MMTLGILGSILGFLSDTTAQEAPVTPRLSSTTEERLHDETLYLQEETVSIASRYEQPISQAPSNVYVITEEDIRQSGATDLPTVLRRVPGLDVMQTSGGEFNVAVRGDNQPVANKLLVMIDGRSIYSDVQGVVFWKLLPITVPEIKRIEILKGPASSVYGFNAFDGIINIITKSPEEMKGTTLQFGGGALGTISSAAIHAGTHGKLGYRLSVGHDQNQQWRDRNALAFRSEKINAQADYTLSAQSRVSVSGGLVDSNRFDGVVAYAANQSNTPAQAYANVLYEKDRFVIRAWWSQFTTTSFNRTNPLVSGFLDTTNRDGNVDYPFAGNTYNLESQHSLNLGSSDTLLYGINYRHNTLSSSSIERFTRENRLGLYLQNDWRLPNAPITISTGLRYDIDTFIHPTVSPRLTALYEPIRDHTFHVSLSLAYRPPTIFERRFDERATTTLPLPPPLSTRTTVVHGSTALSAERIISYEAGYHGWYWNHRLRFRVDLFLNHISNLIDFREASPGVVTSFNDASHADIYGAEAGLEFLATRHVSGFVNYVFQSIEQSFIGNARRGVPHSKLNLGLRGGWDYGLSGEATFNYVGAATYPIGDVFASLAPFGVAVPNERVASYSIVNLRLGYRFWQQKSAAGYMRTAECAVSVFNAINDEHKEYALGDTIGRRVMGWLTLRF